MCDDHPPPSPVEPAPGWTEGLSRRAVLALSAAALLVPACARYAQVDGIWYTCLAGDTLSAISRRSGADINRIVESNQLATYRLAPGQRLFLPGVVAIAEPVAAPRPTKSASVPPPEPDEPVDAPKGYTLVPRSAWTDQPVAGNVIPFGTAHRIAVHHTDEHQGMAGKPDIDVIRSIENYHRNSKGWAAIGYHFLVGKDGRVYEGRPLRFQGAHCQDENRGSIGVSVIGNYMGHLPAPRQITALRALLNDLRSVHKVPAKNVQGHREWRPGWTQCPGDSLLDWVRAYRGA